MSVAVPALLEVDLRVERRAVTVQAGFRLEAGDRLAIFGTSGAGKTTILESIAGLTRLSGGSVRIGGRLVAGKLKGQTALAPRDRQVAIVRQPTTLFPHLTVEQNVAYGVRHSPGRNHVAELLERLGLTVLARARGAALSGGQRQTRGSRKGPRRAVPGAVAGRAAVGSGPRRPRGAPPARHRDLARAGRRESSSPTTSRRRRGSPTGSG